MVVKRRVVRLTGIGARVVRGLVWRVWSPIYKISENARGGEGSHSIRCPINGAITPHAGRGVPGDHLYALLNKQAIGGRRSFHFMGHSHAHETPPPLLATVVGIQLHLVFPFP